MGSPLLVWTVFPIISLFGASGLFDIVLTCSLISIIHYTYNFGTKIFQIVF